MTGADLKRLRARLGLDHYVLSKALGVHPSTLYRWELGSSSLGADPLHVDILAQFMKWVRKTSKRDRETFVSHLRRAVADDPLAALHFLLGQILEIA